MFLTRRPKERPGAELVCPDCGQPVEWQRCAQCDGYGAWDAGVGAFDCVFCGGTGWQAAPHVCPGQGSVGDAEAAEERVALGESPAGDSGPSAGAARKTMLVLLVALILFLILATTLAALFIPGP